MNSAPLPTVSAYMVMLWQYGVAKLRQSDVLSTIQHNKGIKIVDTQWRNFTTGYLLRLIALNIFMEKTTICYCDYQNHRPYIVLKRHNFLLTINSKTLRYLYFLLNNLLYYIPCTLTTIVRQAETLIFSDCWIEKVNSTLKGAKLNLVSTNINLRFLLQYRMI